MKHDLPPRPIRLHIVFLIVGLTILVLWLILPKSKPILSSSQIPKADSANTVSRVEIQPSNLAAAGLISKTEKLMSLAAYHQMLFASEGDFRFYGRILDQNNEPVVQATGVFLASYYNPTNMTQTNHNGDISFGCPSFKELVAQSDETGRFQIETGRGITLRLQSLEKTGYEFEPLTGGSLDYGKKFRKFGVPYWDSAQPRIFKAWKKAGSPVAMVPVKAVIRYRRMTGDEKSIHWYVNLITGKVSEQIFSGADLAITLSLVQPGNGKEDYGHLLVESLDGLLAATDHVKPFLAPADLVGTKWECRFDRDYRDNNKGLQNVYARLRSGKLWFGGEIDARPGPTLTIRGYINPDGSRNLEPDPSKLITGAEEIRRLDAETRIIK